MSGSPANFPTYASSSKVPTPVAGWAALVCAAAIIVGAFGPWAVLELGERFRTSISGTDGSGDGWLTLGLAVLTGILLLVRIARRVGRYAAWIAVILFGLITLIGIIDWANLEADADRFEAVPAEIPVRASLSAGWGLIVTTIAGFLGAVLSIVHILREYPKAATPAAGSVWLGGLVPGSTEVPAHPVPADALPDVTTEEHDTSTTPGIAAAFVPASAEGDRREGFAVLDPTSTKPNN